MKRLGLWLCICGLLLSTTACTTEFPEEHYYEQALTAIEKGDFLNAYNLLSAYVAVCDNLDAVETLEKLVFVPVLAEETRPDSHQLNTFRYDGKGKLLQVDGNVGEQQRTLREYTYDNKGRLVLVKSGDGTVTTYTYDQKGNRATMQIDIAGYVTQVHYTYDEQGRCLTEKQVDASGSTQKKTYRYDEDGKKTFERTVKFDNSYEQLSYRYDEDGNKIYQLQENSNGDRYETTYHYVKNLLTAINNPNGSIVTYTYDKSGKCLTKKTKSAQGEVLDTTYTYDKNGNCLSATNENGKRTYTYDTYGNKLSETYVDRQNRTFVWRFEWKPFYYPEGLIKEWEAIRSEAIEEHTAIML